DGVQQTEAVAREKRRGGQDPLLWLAVGRECRARPRELAHQCPLRALETRDEFLFDFLRASERRVARLLHRALQCRVDALYRAADLRVSRLQLAAQVREGRRDLGREV